MKIKQMGNGQYKVTTTYYGNEISCITRDSRSILDFNSSPDELDGTELRAKRGYKALQQECIKANKLTYNIHFDSESSSNDKGFAQSFGYCLDYIEQHNGTKESYFEDYKGGTVSIVCLETGDTVFQTTIF